VTIRIDVTGQHGRTVVVVAGRLQGGAVDELSRACREIRGPVTLDLTELRAADEAGIGLLRALQTTGAEIRGLSPYLQLLMDEEPSSGNAR
jgi:anti-anti-sigma regulatory factor